MFLLVLFMIVGISISFAHEGCLGKKGGNSMVYGMMGGYGGYGMMSSGMFWLNGFLGFLLLIGLVLLVWLWVFKSWNELTKKGKK